MYSIGALIHDQVTEKKNGLDPIKIAVLDSVCATASSVGLGVLLLANKGGRIITPNWAWSVAFLSASALLVTFTIKNACKIFSKESEFNIEMLAPFATIATMSVGLALTPPLARILGSGWKIVCVTENCALVSAMVAILGIAVVSSKR